MLHYVNERYYLVCVFVFHRSQMRQDPNPTNARSLLQTRCRRRRRVGACWLLLQVVRCRAAGWRAALRPAGLANDACVRCVARVGASWCWLLFVLAAGCALLRCGLASCATSCWVGHRCVRCLVGVWCPPPPSARTPVAASLLCAPHYYFKKAVVVTSVSQFLARDALGLSRQGGGRQAGIQSAARLVCRFFPCESNEEKKTRQKKKKKKQKKNKNRNKKNKNKKNALPLCFEEQSFR